MSDESSGFEPAPPPPHAARARNVTAVVPCFNRPADAAALLSDLASLRLDSAPPDSGIFLSVVLVDNASDRPLADLDAPAGLTLEHLRLERNTGGSGGFNAGMRLALGRGARAGARDLIWLLDSDVRVEPDALAELVRALDRHPDLCAAGSVLVDPATGDVFEAGGFVNPRTGELTQPPPEPGAPIVPCEYLAACSVLVRRQAVEAAGLMADVFVSGDDVEWGLRLRAATGGRLAAVPASRVRHPHHNKMRTWARYYAARNAFAVLDRLGAGRATRFRRAVREAGRALGQSLVGRDDLADLHLAGLRAALDGPRTGPAPQHAVRFDRFAPIAELPGAIRAAAQARPGKQPSVVIGPDLSGHEATVQEAAASLAGTRVERAPHGPAEPRPRDFARLARRLLAGPAHDLAVVSARARPADWLSGRCTVTIAPEGFAVRTIRRGDRTRRALSIVARGSWLAARLAARRPDPLRIEPAPRPEESARRRPTPTTRLSTSVVILSYNRWPALEATLGKLADDRGLRDAETIVVDNHSTDGTPGKLAARFPAVRLIEMGSNAGIAGFNRGAAAAGGDVLLILDDDSWPAEGALTAALDLLSRRPEIDAVPLLPRHPATGLSEWPFAERVAPSDDWPVMGCANLVRREAWNAVGGYEESFFLYRNDVDLALKLLGAGRKVHFNPAWSAWHDTPAGARGRKSDRWFELATRNWVRVCRRHGRGSTKWAAIIAAWAQAHRLAATEWSSHRCILRGVRAGFRGPEPVIGNGVALRRYLSARGTGAVRSSAKPPAIGPAGAPGWKAP